ncbi:hypothetical protein ACFSCX_09855 [Bacillus salitolerans]|uniref:DUF3221 domain-containing protein n=1 Tax=Bacillus salitolerans TaxID=1437434 RepID=A0ABW4LP23_9BACI
MKKLSLILSLILLSIGLLGCKQSIEGHKQNNTIAKIDKGIKDEFDITGTITEIDKDRNRVLLNVTKKAIEEQIWLTVGKYTKISNEKHEKFSFMDLKTEVKLKANISGDICAESLPIICSARDIVIEE